MSYSIEALNTMTQTLRDGYHMAQPTEPAPEPVTYPPCAYVDDVPDSTTQFVRDLVAIEAERDGVHLRACDLASAFVALQHPTSPNYPTYMNTQKQLRAAAALEMCFAPNTVIKAYRAAVVRAFGALPISLSPEAQRKAAARAAAKAASEALDDTERRGVPEHRHVPEHDLIGQFIARHGAAAVLTELAKILATEKSTVEDAHALIDVARHIAN